MFVTDVTRPGLYYCCQEENVWNGAEEEEEEGVTCGHDHNTHQ